MSHNLMSLCFIAQYNRYLNTQHIKNKQQVKEIGDLGTAN